MTRRRGDLALDGSVVHRRGDFDVRERMGNVDPVGSRWETDGGLSVPMEEGNGLRIAYSTRRISGTR